MRTRTDLSFLPVVLSLGAVCQIGQVVVLREFLTVFHGNELSFGIILAAWMAWVGIGSSLAGAVVWRVRSMRPLEAVAAALLFLLPATVLALRLVRSFHSAQPGAYLPVAEMILSAAVVVAPSGTLLGAMFVLLAMGWRQRENRLDTEGGARSYIAEAAGHAAGGVLFTFLLAQRANSFVLMTGAGLMLACAALLLTRGRSRLLIAASVVAAVSLPMLPHLDEWAHMRQWQAFAPRHELVEVAQSRYGAVSVLEREGQYSFYQSGNFLFSVSGPDAASPLLEEQDAVVSAHLAMAQHPDPRRILLLGGGLRGVLREAARHPVERIDYVELDPVVTDLARRRLSPAATAELDRGNVRVVHGDGRLFMKTSTDSYDLIMVDAPEPVTAVLNRYYTEEFFREAAASLGPGGVLAIGAVSTADLRGSEIVNRNATIYHTLRLVFPHVLPVGERQIHFFASGRQGVVTADPLVLEERFNARGVTAPGFSPGQYRQILLEGPLRSVNWIIRNHGRAEDAWRVPPDAGPLFPASIADQEMQESALSPVRSRHFINSDFRPVGYVHTVAFWSHFTAAGRTAAFRWILRVEPWWMVPVLVILLLGAVILRRPAAVRSGAGIGRYPLLAAVFTTGLSTMTLQIALLFAFQAVYGFVYEMIGAIVGGFMAGLAAGTLATLRFVRLKSDTRILMLVQLAIALCAGLIALALPLSGGIASPSLQLALFLGVTFIAGFLNGVDFPLAAACFHALDGKAERATGTVYGVELFGACCGALLAGVMVAPVLGVGACCWLAAIGNGAAFLVLLISGGAHGAPKGQAA